MSSRGCTHLEPLPSHLTGRTLALRLDDLPCKRPLQAKRAPRPVCGDVSGPPFEQEQIGHDRHRHRALNTVGLFGDLMLAQTDHAFQF